jgi:hypothetical protein
MEDISEQLDAMIQDLDEDDLTDALSLLERIESSSEMEVQDGNLARLLLRAYVAGRATAPDRSNDTDLLVGITPEDAATLVAGLLGDGATLTLSVVRHG